MNKDKGLGVLEGKVTIGTNPTNDRINDMLSRIVKPRDVAAKLQEIISKSKTESKQNYNPVVGDIYQLPDGREEYFFGKQPDAGIVCTRRDSGVSRALAYLIEHYNEPVSAQDLMEATGWKTLRVVQEGMFQLNRKMNYSKELQLVQGGNNYENHTYQLTEKTAPERIFLR